MIVTINPNVANFHLLAVYWKNFLKTGHENFFFYFFTFFLSYFYKLIYLLEEDIVEFSDSERMLYESESL